MTSKWNDVGLLTLRLGVGSALAAHGAQKLFGWFGGYGPAGTGQWLDSMGFKGPGKLNAVLAGLGEFGGGTLLALGLGTGAAGAAVAGTMTVAGSTHASNGFFNTSGGYELPATYALVGASLALGGPGRYSVDHLLGHSVNRKWMAIAGLVSTLGSAAYLVLTREQPEPPAEVVDAAESAADETAPAETIAQQPEA